MIRNKTSFKLSSYFAIALLIFAFIMGISFSFMFRKHTIKTHKMELSSRAKSIATTVSSYLESNRGEKIGIGFGAYMRSLSSIAGADAWVIDKDKNLVTKGNGKGVKFNKDHTIYPDLPEDADKIISQVFLDKTEFSENFSGVFKENILTVGVPVKGNDEKIIGIVLLQSKVLGAEGAFKNGIKFLSLSILLGLLISFILSLWLSKKFTSPILKKEAEDAIRLDKIRRRFVANISHELKTPVTVMRGSLEALTDNIVTNPKKVNEYHRQMLKESIYLQRLISDLLDLSKLQSEDFPIKKQEVSVLQVLEETIRSAKHIAKNKNILIKFHKDGDMFIKGDYGRLRQMIMIILDNAIKFSSKDSNIDVLFKEKKLIIKDYGKGIPEKDVPFIFERFYKAPIEGNKSGTGLGLAIAKQIADRHSINLSVKSKEGSGSEFIFKF